MAWNPYTDWQNRGFAHILTSLFPEQTKTLPRILVWSVIFLIDLIVIAFAAAHFGLLELSNNQIGMKLVYVVLIIAVIAVFWLQGVIWGAIMKPIRELRR